MIDLQHIRAGEEYPQRLDLAELRQDVTGVISLALTIASAVFWVAVLPGRGFHPLEFAIYFSLFLQGLLARWLSRARPQLAPVALVIGSVLAFAAALNTFASPLVPLAALLIVIAAFAMDAAYGLGATIVLVLLFVVAVPASDYRNVLLGFLIATAGIEWISSRPAYTALNWAWQSRRRAAMLLEEVRERRGELRKTLAALTEASRRLERTNQELSAARREAEEARALKEHFVASVSHELRTPLNLIVGFAELIYLAPETYEGAVWTPELENDLQEIYRASRHLQSLVDDVLDISMIDAEHLPLFRELLDIRIVVQEAVATLRPLLDKRGLYCRVEFPAEVPALLIDRTRIRQVMLNLLNNAARFADRGGITVRMAVVDDAVIVSVEDTGVGIHEDQLEHIFDKFYRINTGPRSRGGTGLGLAISRTFVELHGGEMWVQSQVGVGSTFEFSIPIHTALARRSLKRLPYSERAPQRQAPLLVVDPDPNTVEMLRRPFGETPVLGAHDLHEMERLIEEHHPAGILINVPPGASLQEWTGDAGFLTQRYNIPLVRCSIPSFAWLQEFATVDNYLLKPLSMNAVLRLLEMCPEAACRITILDDDPSLVGLLMRMLESAEQVEMVRYAYSLGQLIELGEDLAPGLLFIDVPLLEKGEAGQVAAVRELMGRSDVTVVGLTNRNYARRVLDRRSQEEVLTVTQARGIGSNRLFRALKGVLAELAPDYLVEENSSSST